MRNLKRALSLTLASVMLLGMMVLGTSAASYPDVTDEHNVEAIEVLQAVGVMSGSNSGNFNPDGKVTRIEMAIVMANLLNLNVDYFQGQNTFSDVPEWASGYVNACAASGIVTGVGGGRFGTGNVTATQAALMMLKALGYFQYNSDFGSDWARATANQAAKLRLFDGIDVRDNTQLTRNQVAQLALNALKTPVVEPDDDTLNITTPDGTTVVGGNVKYVVTASAKDYAYAIDDTESNGNALNGINGGVIELGEKLYNGKLKLNDQARDDFGRPSRRWENDGKEVGVYAKKEEMRQEYTQEVTGRDLYDLLGSSIINDSRWTFTITVDGESRYSATNGVNGVNTVFNKSYMRKDNKSGVGGTGNGVLTQVFVDADDKTVDIAVINTYLAKADADYNDKKDEASFKVHGIDMAKSGNVSYYWKHMADSNSNDPGTDSIMSASGEDFYVEDIKKDDIYRVTVADGAIQTLDKVETVEAVTLDAFKLDDYVTAGDVTYKYAKTARYDVEVLENWTGNNGASNLKDKKYNIYLDAYGYLLGVDLAEGEDNYVFITGVDANTSNLSAKTYDANAIFLDGTMKTITVDNSDNDLQAPVGADHALHNRWYTYTVNSKDVYKLGEIKQSGASTAINTASTPKVKVAQYWQQTTASAGQEIDVKHIALKGAGSGSYSSVYGNDDTVYLNVETKAIQTTNTGVGAANNRGVIDKVGSVITGIKNANLDVLKKGDSTANKPESAWAMAERNGGLSVNDNNFAYGTYVLYKDNGYIIAAVTVAGDAEGSDSLVYVNSGSINREAYNSTDDEWTWQREVIINGEKVTLTERDVKPTELTKMIKYNWYKVTYDSKGEVLRVKHAIDARSNTRDTTQAYEHDIDYLPAAIQNGKDTILFEQSRYDGYTGTNCPDVSPSPATHTASNWATGSRLEGSTFYAVNTSTTGVYVDETVKTVLVQTNDNKETTETYNGTSGLKYVLDHLNKDSSNNLKYEISMVVTNGFAKVVVIRDGNKGGTAGTPEVTTGLYWHNDNAGNNFANPQFHTNGTVAVTANTDDIYAMLAAAGCTDISKGTGAAGVNWTFTKPNGIKLTGVNITADQQVLITPANGAAFYYDVNTNTLTAANAYGKAWDAAAGAYAKATTSAGSTYVGPFTTGSETIPVAYANITFEFGYLDNTGMTIASGKAAVEEAKKGTTPLNKEHPAVATYKTAIDQDLVTALDPSDPTIVNVTGSYDENHITQGTLNALYPAAGNPGNTALDPGEVMIVPVGFKVPAGAKAVRFVTGNKLNDATILPPTVPTDFDTTAAYRIVASNFANYAKVDITSAVASTPFAHYVTAIWYTGNDTDGYVEMGRNMITLNINLTTITTTP